MRTKRRPYIRPEVLVLAACAAQMAFGWWLLPQPFSLAVSLGLLVVACIMALRP